MREKLLQEWTDRGPICGRWVLDYTTDGNAIVVNTRAAWRGNALMWRSEIEGKIYYH